MYDQDSPANDGKIESTNFTKSQKMYTEILSHLARLAKYIEMRNVSFWVEKPDGYRKMLDEIGKDGKVYDQLTSKEIETYEKKFRYEKITAQRLGGSQVFLQHMILEAHQDESIKKLWKDMLEEIKEIASKETADYMEGKDEKITR